MTTGMCDTRFNKTSFFVWLDRVILGCLCFMIFCLPFTKAGIEAFVWLAFFLWLLKRALGYRSDMFWGMVPQTELNIALGLFVAANVLATVFSVDHLLSLRGFFGKELKSLAVFFISVEILQSRGRLRLIVMSIVVAAILMTVDAGVQYFTGTDFLRKNEIARLRASFSNSNGFGGWLAIMIPFMLGLWAACRPKKHQHNVMRVFGRKAARTFLFVLALLLGVCLVMTYSRGAWLGVAIGLVLMMGYALMAASLKIRIFSLVGVLCVGIVLLMLPQEAKEKMKAIGRVKFRASETINQRLKSMVNIEVDSGSGSVRINLWKEALIILRDHPWFGCGLNTYARVAPRYRISPESGIYPHNSYLQKAAETGSFGLLSFLFVLFAFFKNGLHHLNTRNNSLVAGLMAGLFAFLIHTFFDNHLYALQLVVLFWFMLGLTIAVINIDQRGAAGSGFLTG